MKFLTLLKKEMRESLPWIILSVFLLLIAGWFAINAQIPDQQSWFSQTLQNGRMFEIFQSDIMVGATSVILYISIGLGLVLGIRQFWIPGFSGTWQYLIHRSVKRSTIISAKVVSAIIIISFLILVWLLLAGYTYISKKIIVPADSGIVFLGIFYGYLGILAYFGTALCAITKAHWYTTKMFALAFVLIVLLFIFIMLDFTSAYFAYIIIAVMLGIQIYQTFLQKEF